MTKEQLAYTVINKKITWKKTPNEEWWGRASIYIIYLTTRARGNWYWQLFEYNKDNIYPDGYALHEEGYYGNLSYNKAKSNAITYVQHNYL